MVNLVSKTRKKLIIKELDPGTDLLKIFHHTQAHPKTFFLIVLITMKSQEDTHS